MVILVAESYPPKRIKKWSNYTIICVLYYKVSE